MNRIINELSDWLYIFFIMIPFLLFLLVMVIWRKFLTLFGIKYVSPLEGIE